MLFLCNAIILQALIDHTPSKPDHHLEWTVAGVHIRTDWPHISHSWLQIFFIPCANGDNTTHAGSSVPRGIAAGQLLWETTVISWGNSGQYIVSCQVKVIAPHPRFVRIGMPCGHPFIVYHIEISTVQISTRATMVTVRNCKRETHDSSSIFPTYVDMWLHVVLIPEQSTMFCGLSSTNPLPEREEAPSRASIAANAYEQLQRSFKCERNA